MATIDAAAVKNEIARRKAQVNYEDHIKYCYPEYYLTHFHSFLCNKIQWCLDHPSGKRWNIVLLACPPRHGKSYLLPEKLPAYYLGQHPRGEIIITGYGTTIAEQFGRTARENYERVAAKVWPETAGLSPSVQSAGHWETKLGGKCHSAGLLAPLTGYGADVLIIDDPIKNMDQADSEVIIEKIQTGLIPDVFSRVYPNGYIFVINTRWVENDVTGWIRENMSEYILMDLSLPALCEDPEHDPLGRKKDEALIGPHMGDDMSQIPSKIAITTEIMKQQRAASILANGERYWNALYQNHPSNEMGNLVDVTKFDLMNTEDMFIQGKQEPGRMPIKPMEYNILSIDCSFSNKETSDFVAMGLWGYRDNQHYLIHLVNMRLSFTQTINKIREILDEYKDVLTVDEICIENKANGPAVIDVLRQEEGMPPIVEVDASRGSSTSPNNKAARAKAITPYIERGQVHIATNSPQGDVEQVTKGENLKPHELFLHQWKQFPYGKKDDMVDMTSQYLARAHKLIEGEEPKYSRTIQKTSHWTKAMWRIYEQMTPEEQEEFVKSVGIPYEWVPDED